ncbi:MAG: hypothetical protein R3E01_03980 [Pirellulaceae bacterium]|nr:hypothetical protein [Planctomycetales bacterium]
MAEPLLKGKQSCTVVPAVTYAVLLPAAIRLPDRELAKSLHNKGYRKVKNNPSYLDSCADHLVYVVCVGNWKRAIELLERHTPWLISACDLIDKFHFHLATMLLLESLVAHGHKRYKVRLPKELNCYRQSDDYDLAELAQWYRNEVDSIANRFNQRNGNDYFCHIVAEYRQLVTR